jgi:Glycosyltransferases involved in cell wall biogenesis
MTVLIPAFEPDKKLLRLVSELIDRTNYSILIVDDGSGFKYEGLFSEARRCGCTVLHNRTNLGKGAALKTGFKYLLDTSNPDHVVCADADGQHKVSDIIRVANAIDKEKSTMVLGVRQFKGSVPLRSRLGNSITAFMFKSATGLEINDTQTGLRGYPRTMLFWLVTVEGQRYEYELNLLLSSKEHNIGIKQVVIETVYENNNKGSHFRTIRDSIRVFAPILKFCASSISSALIDFGFLFLFQALTGSLFWGVVLARVISSSYNYIVNRFLVFKAGMVSNAQSAPKYFGLAALIITLNYFIIRFLTSTIGIPDVPAKLLTEIILFMLSYSIQKLFVFRKRTGLAHVQT